MAFSDLPDWQTSDPRAALSAFARSCAVLSEKPPTDAMGGIGYAGNVGDWRAACRAIPSGAMSASAARRFFESWARPVAVGSGDDRDGTFTGYYEAEIDASRMELIKCRSMRRRTISSVSMSARFWTISRAAVSPAASTATSW
jgi:membrane-bound lytic murein transglycosylase A